MSARCAPELALPPRIRHPIQPYRTSLEPPLRTNSFFSELFLKDGCGKVFVHPYVIELVPNDGIKVTMPSAIHNEPGGAATATVSFAEQPKITKVLQVASFDLCSASLHAESSPGHPPWALTIPVVRGMAFATFRVKNLTPLISVPVASAGAAAATVQPTVVPGSRGWRYLLPLPAVGEATGSDTAAGDPNGAATAAAAASCWAMYVLPERPPHLEGGGGGTGGGGGGSGRYGRDDGSAPTLHLHLEASNVSAFEAPLEAAVVRLAFVADPASLPLLDAHVATIVVGCDVVLDGVDTGEMVDGGAGSGGIGGDISGGSSGGGGNAFEEGNGSRDDGCRVSDYRFVWHVEGPTTAVEAASPGTMNCGATPLPPLLHFAFQHHRESMVWGGGSEVCGGSTGAGPSPPPLRLVPELTAPSTTKGVMSGCLGNEWRLHELCGAPGSNLAQPSPPLSAVTAATAMRNSLMSGVSDGALQGGHDGAADGMPGSSGGCSDGCVDVSAWLPCIDVPLECRLQILAALQADVAAVRACGGVLQSGHPDAVWSNYFGGKAIFRVAQMALVACALADRTSVPTEETGSGGNGYPVAAAMVLADAAAPAAAPEPELELLRECLELVRGALAPFVANAQANPLRYDELWGGLVPTRGLGWDRLADFGASAYNDKQYHYAYFIQSAAILARLDPAAGEWCAAWVELLIADVSLHHPSNEFPLFRSFDWFSGHCWSRGILPSPVGKDVESLAEEINCHAAVALWGLARGRPELERLGRLMAAVCVRASRCYFLMEDGCTAHPPDVVAQRVPGIFFEGELQYRTWFGDKTEYIHGIQMMPVTPALAALRSMEFVAAEWPRLEDALRSTLSEKSGWASVLLTGGLAFLRPREAYDLLRADTTVMDDGLARSWAMLWAASQPGWDAAAAPMREVASG